MKNTELRKQLADSIRYLRRIDGFWSTRPYTEILIASEVGSITVDQLLHFCTINNKTPDQVYVEGWSGEDYDGCPEDGVRVSCYELTSDEMWFEQVCAEVMPTEYQQQEYDQYLRLRAKYE